MDLASGFRCVTLEINVTLIYRDNGKTLNLHKQTGIYPCMSSHNETDHYIHNHVQNKSSQMRMRMRVLFHTIERCSAMFCFTIHVTEDSLAVKHRTMSTTCTQFTHG